MAFSDDRDAATSYSGALPPLTAEEAQLRDHLAAEVSHLSVDIGDRSLLHSESLQTASDYLSGFLREQGYSVVEHPYFVKGKRVSNLEAVLPGRERSLGQVIVGAHYDSVAGTVAADDNGSGVAGLLEIARLIRHTQPRRTIRIVFFVNEEPPFFQTAKMGSRVYAHELHAQGVSVSAMFSLETIGFYSDQKGSQKYPPVLNLFYPDKGDFIGIVGNRESRSLVRETLRNFRSTTRFPSEGIAAPGSLPGIGWSDQWSFWQEGYPGVMVTDTAPFRYAYYHTVDDTVDKLDFDKTARVVEGILSVVEAAAEKP